MRQTWEQSEWCLSVWLLLTTLLLCAAADCLVGQLLSRLTASRTWHGGARNRLALGAHGIAVTFTDAATAGPCFAGLTGEEQTVSYAAVAIECMRQVSVLTCLGLPSGPTQSEILKRKRLVVVWVRHNQGCAGSSGKTFLLSIFFFLMTVRMYMSWHQWCKPFFAVSQLDWSVFARQS